jgi:tetratricopeptide (TPR) repeat protein
MTTRGVPSSSSSSSSAFSSEGFDLDTVINNAGDGSVTNPEDVVYEIGGGFSSMQLNSSTTNSNANGSNATTSTSSSSSSSCSPIDVAEQYKAEGNDLFLAGKFDEAYERYTLAIQSTPGPYRGEDLLLQRESFDREEGKRLREELNQREERERLKRQRDRQREKEKARTTNNSAGTATNSSTTFATTTVENDLDSDDDEDKRKEELDETRRTFVAPPHPYASNLAVYFSNRAAVRLRQAPTTKLPVIMPTGANTHTPSRGSMDDDSSKPQLPPSVQKLYDSVIDDTSIAVLFNPTYVKAYHRRSIAYENIGSTDKALEDAKLALQYSPRDVSLQKLVSRLQKVEDERMEKLKTETMDKLKDLGNSILSNFGLSLDNFKATQDPKTGSYSINFQQNANK